MTKSFLKVSAIVILFTLLFTSNPVLAVSDSVNVGQRIVYFCNDNLICEPNLNETAQSCPGDCGCNNNGVCETLRGETIENCPFDCAIPYPPDGPIDTTPPVIYDLFISKITLDSATVSWRTDELALCELFWGQTQEYTQETISEESLFFKHSTQLLNLLYETTYHFKIVCQDVHHNESETKDQKFTTLSLPDITPPVNVSNFQATPADKQITLSWQNPPDSDFKAVRIMRSTDFYPANPWSGTPVYNDKGTSVIDTGLINGTTYYYTAFAYDNAGNYSSGAIVSAVPSKIKPPILPPPEKITTEEGCEEAGYYWYDDACHAEPKIPPPPPEVEKITLEDFDFIQKDKKIPIIKGKIIKIKTEEPLTISIDYEKVPEVLKTITVTLEKENKFFSFLLRINKEKTAYEAVLVPPQEAGIYPLTITILDYKNQTMKKIRGVLKVEGITGALLPSKIPWYKSPHVWKWILYLLLGILLAIMIRYLRKKIREKKSRAKNTNQNKKIYTGYH